MTYVSDANRALCLELMRADSQEKVVALLQNVGYWDNDDAWRFLGDQEGNWSSIGNQQSEAVAALIEKVVNSIDSRLVNACLEVGVDPESNKAPKSIRDAVALFFDGDRDPDSEIAGRIVHWDGARLTAEGRLITVAATGFMPGDGLPSITIADRGEGQTPDAFPETFLSLSRTNKFRIHFVQGKFNMGGTGALQYCNGPNKMQLIVSRRNPAILPSGATPRDHEWGFTVVRREPPKAGGRSSVFTYLAPVDLTEPRRGRVLSFAAELLPIFPEADAKVRDAYFRASEYGSLVKLYEYEWQGVRSNVVLSGGGLLRRIDTGLPEVALPVRVFECRPAYKGHAGSFATNVLGLATRLELDKVENLEPDFPITSVLDLDGRKVRIRTYAFKKGKASGYRTAKQGVIFAVNGQAHASLPTYFFRKKEVGMSYLADSLLVMADCTDILGEMREELFMNSRDRLRDNALSQKLEGEIAQLLKDDPTLRALRNSRREAELAEKLSDSQPLADVLEGILKHSPMLAKLFLTGQKIASPFPPSSGSGDGASSDFEGKTYPTFLRFKGLKTGEVLKRDVHIESRIRIAFETDAVDDYFDRELDKGTAELLRVRHDGSSEPATNWILRGPKKGALNLSLSVSKDAIVGEDIELKLVVTDPSRVEPFENSMLLKVRPGSAPAGSGGNGTRHAANTDTGIKGTASTLALPEITPVHEPEWDKHGFNEFSALAARHAGETESGADIYDFFINVDNRFLRLAEKESGEDPKLLEARFTYAMVLLGLSILRPPTKLTEENGDSSGSGDVEDIIANFSTAVAPVLLPMIEAMSSLALPDE
jgi:hypothetical protein